MGWLTWFAVSLLATSAFGSVALNDILVDFMKNKNKDWDVSTKEETSGSKTVVSVRGVYQSKPMLRTEDFRFQKAIAATFQVINGKSSQAMVAVQNASLVCPSGSTVQGHGCLRQVKAEIAVNGTEKKASCPNGFTANENNPELCVTMVAGDCKDGFIREGDGCTKYGCQNNYDKIDDRCLEKCPSGYKRLYSTLCITEETVCPPNGFRKVGDQCVLEKCPRNFVELGVDCVYGCRNGFEMVEGVCQTDKFVDCPRGYYRLTGAICTIRDCPKGEVKFSKKSCVSTDFIECPKGFETIEGRTMCTRCINNENNKCLQYEDTCPLGWFSISPIRCVRICPSDMAAFGTQCISLKQKSCPPNYLLVKDQGCLFLEQCPSNMRQFDRECLPKETGGCSAFTLNGECVTRCPSGHTVHESRCIEVSLTNCPPNNYFLDDEYCVSTCPSGYKAVGGRCIASKECGSKEFLYRDACLSACPPGATESKVKGQCVLRKDACPSNRAQSESGGCMEKRLCTGILDRVFHYCYVTRFCKPGEIYFGGYCLNKCPIGFSNIYDTCRHAGDSLCPTGVRHNGECLENCPSGYVPKLGICILAEVQVVRVEVKCGPNMIVQPCDTKGCTPQCVCKPDFILPPGAKDYCIPKGNFCPMKNKLDIIYIIDGSANVHPEDFGKVKLLLLESLTHLIATNIDIRIGLIVFGSQAPKNVFLYQYKQHCDMMGCVVTLEPVGGNETNLITALRMVRNFHLSQCYGARIGASRQIYILALNKNLGKAAELHQELNIHKELGHRVVVVSVGMQTKLPENIYNLFAKDYSALSRFSRKLADISCLDVQCPKGYTLRKDGRCDDIDECAKTVCHSSAICINLPGSYDCYCPPGQEYLGLDKGCLVPPEVLCDKKVPTDKEVCSVIKCTGTATCVAHNGDGFCLCPPGYVYQKDSGCGDYNECQDRPCLGAASCINTIGSFNCTCPKGYTYDKNFGCIDINECVVINQPCSGNGKCENSVGSYSCICDKGYEYIRDVGCKDIDECATIKPCSGEAVTCKNLQGSFECTCANGFEYTKDGCKDIDECHVQGIDACGQGVNCNNTVGGFKCSCVGGYVYNAFNKTCVVDTDKGVTQRRADVVFVVDSSDDVSDALYPKVTKLVGDILTDFKNADDKVIRKISTVKLGKPSKSGGTADESEVVYANETVPTAIEKTKDLNKSGGKANIIDGLTTAQTIYKTNGQDNSTKLVYLILGSNIAGKGKELDRVVTEVNKIKKDGKLFVILVGQNNSRDSWDKVFPGDDLQKYVILVREEMIHTIHTMIFQKTETLIECPNGFIFLNNVCQFKTALTEYCKFDDKLYAINSTWQTECVQYKCVDNGVQVISTKCMGADGDCYEIGDEFPCYVNGEYNDWCLCNREINTDGLMGKESKSKQIIRIDSAKVWDRPAPPIEGNGTCIIPFKFKEKWYYKCTDYASPARPWCSMTKIYDLKWAYCLAATTDCLVDGKVRKHNEQWSVDCNTLTCLTGLVSVVARCKTADNDCVGLRVRHECIINNKRESNCMCFEDSATVYKFGFSKVTGSSSSETEHKTGMVKYCEQKTTGQRFELNDEWTEDCYRLKCVEGNTQILQRRCKGFNDTCYDIGSKRFPCTIRSKTYPLCDCVEDKDRTVLVATENGKQVTEESKYTQNVEVLGNVQLLKGPGGSAGGGSSSSGSSVVLVGQKIPAK